MLIIKHVIYEFVINILFKTIKSNFASISDKPKPIIIIYKEEINVKSRKLKSSFTLEEQHDVLVNYELVDYKGNS